MGIANIETFNIREYLVKGKRIKELGRFDNLYWTTFETGVRRESCLIKEKNIHLNLFPISLIEDSLLKMYLLFQHVSNLKAWRDIVDAVREKSEELKKPLPVYGNQCDLGGTWPSAVLFSQINDVVWTEAASSLNEYIPVRTPAGLSGTAKFKLGLASGLHEKPLWVAHHSISDIPDDNLRLTINKLIWSETLANGGVPDIGAGYRYNGVGYNELVEFTKFINENRSLFLDRKSYANVALVYSLPSLIYRFGGISFKESAQVNEFLGFIRILEDVHMPFDVIVFGHPDLFDDTSVLNNLSKYDMVMLPQADCLSVPQADALGKYVKNGGGLLTTGEIGIRDEYYNRYPKPLLADLSIYNLRGGITSDYCESIARNTPDKTVLAQVAKVIKRIYNKKRLIDIDVSPAVVVNMWMSKNEKRLALHLVNYDLNKKEGSVNPVRNIKIKLKVPKDFKFNNIISISSDADKADIIPYKMYKDKVEFALSELKIYSTIVLTKDNELSISNNVFLCKKRINWLKRLGKINVDEFCKELNEIQMLYNNEKYKEITESVEELKNRVTSILFNELDKIENEYTTHQQRLQNALIKKWLVIGPFDNIECQGFNKIYPPEEGINTSIIYHGKNNREIKWLEANTKGNSILLNEILDMDDQIIGYGLTHVFVPSQIKALLWIAAVEGIKVWVNNELKFVDHDHFKELATPGMNYIEIELNKGWNKILVKTEVIPKNKKWWFSISLTDSKNIPLKNMLNEAKPAVDYQFMF